MNLHKKYLDFSFEMQQIVRYKGPSINLPILLIKKTTKRRGTKSPILSYIVYGRPPTVAYAAFYSSNGFELLMFGLFTGKAKEEKHVKLKTLEEFLDFLCQMH